jgi:hypothetical protein
MAKVRKSDGEETFAGARSNDEDARRLQPFLPPPWSGYFGQTGPSAGRPRQSEVNRDPRFQPAFTLLSDPIACAGSEFT